MRQMSSNCATVSLLVILLAACGKSGTPSCSDRDVTDTVVELMFKDLPLKSVKSAGFVNIRTTNRDDGLKKVTCKGDIAEFQNIQYSAQYTEDGQTYVEVY